MDPTVFAAPETALPVALLGLFVLATVVLVIRNRRNKFATPLEKATFGTLHTVALAAPALRDGLPPQSAAFALPYLRTLLDTCALTMTDKTGNSLAWDGE